MGAGTQKGSLIRALTNSGNVLNVSAAVTPGVQYDTIIHNGADSQTFTITILDAAEFGVGFLSVWCDANPTAITVAVPDITNPDNLTAAEHNVLLFSNCLHCVLVAVVII